MSLKSHLKFTLQHEENHSNEKHNYNISKIKFKGLIMGYYKDLGFNGGNENATNNKTTFVKPKDVE
jgi:hypothetical protein